jgi:ATP-binding protein involved in chromosome partitioning
VPLLGSVPLSPTLRSDADAGIPAVLAHPEDPASRQIDQLAAALMAEPRGLAGRSLPLRPR